MATAAPPSGSANGRACCGLLAPPHLVRGGSSLPSLQLGQLPVSGTPGEGLSEVQAVRNWPGKREGLQKPKRAGKPCLESSPPPKKNNLKGDTRIAECKMHPSGGARCWACAPRRSGHRVAQPGTPRPKASTGERPNEG